MPFNWPADDLTVKERVGVGTETPSEKLEIKGNLKLNTGVAIGEFSQDGTFAASSHQSVPTTQATKTYVTAQIAAQGTALSNELANKANKNGALTQDFQANNLTVQGTLEVTGTTTFRNIEQHQGDLELGDQDTDQVRIHGVMRSTHSSGILPIASPVTVTGNVSATRLGIGTTKPGAPLEILAPWGDWLFLQQERDVERGGGFHFHNPWGNSTVSQGAADRNRLEIGYRTAAGQDLWGQFVIHGPTGNVGIGTVSPKTKLEVGGITKTQKLQLGDKWLLSGVGDTAANDDWLRLFNPANSGYFGGLAAGKLWSSQGSVQGSDLRLKRDIQGLTSALQKLLQLRGVSYYWQDANKGTTLQLGLIAQEVQPIFPELVEVGADGMQALNYVGLIPVLVEALKEQQNLIHQLQLQLQAMTTHTNGGLESQQPETLLGYN
jgi:hypothetical protein